MKTDKVDLDSPIKKDYADELERRLFFISQDILDFKVIVHNDLIYGIEVTIPQEADVKKLAEKVNYIVLNEITTQKILPPKIIWNSGKRNGFQKDIYDQMLKKGMIFEMGEGQVCFGSAIMRLMDCLDEKIKDIAVLKMGGQEYRYPTLIATKALEDCGYFNSFPHMLMFVTRLHSDVDVYKGFLEKYLDKKHMDSFVLDCCGNVDYCLPPTMCYHTYHQLRNKQFNENENKVITSKGKSFRYESKYYRTLERLWDFTIREIVFMGAKDFVVDCRRKFMEASFELVERLGLEGYCEVASDPFFCNSDTAAKIFNQKMLELKYELRLNIDENKTVAAASFNFHDQFFGQRFNIKKTDMDWITTGCVGFGIERLAYVFVSKHGLDEEKWYRILGV